MLKVCFIAAYLLAFAINFLSNPLVQYMCLCVCVALHVRL